MRRIKLRILAKLSSKYMKTEFILVLFLFAYGIIGSYLIMDLNLTDSVYYAVITMATVGYGDYTPHTGIQKAFATTLALSGVALLAYVFNVMLTNFQDKMRKYSKGARTMRRIDEMEDYYILCGYGRVGKVVFKELVERNQNVIVLDKNKEAIENIEESVNIVKIHREATEDDFVAKLVNENCNSVIITTGDDVSNLFIVLTIRETNPDAWIVSRACKIENISRLKKAGANKIVSPEIIGGKDLYLESTKPHSLRITVRHNPMHMFDEFGIIVKHKCTLENIDYHFPGIETPMRQEIQLSKFAEGTNYKEYLKNHPQQKKALDNLYDSVNNIHSHWISGPEKTKFDKLIKELGESEEILGINLTDKEIAKLTMEVLSN